MTVCVATVLPCASSPDSTASIVKSTQVGAWASSGIWLAARYGFRSWYPEASVSIVKCSVPVSTPISIAPPARITVEVSSMRWPRRITIGMSVPPACGSPTSASNPPASTPCVFAPTSCAA